MLYPRLYIIVFTHLFLFSPLIVSGETYVTPISDRLFALTKFPSSEFCGPASFILAANTESPTHTQPLKEDLRVEEGEAFQLSSEMWDELQSGWFWRANLVTFGISQGPTNSLINPNNTLDIARHELGFRFRPDFKLFFRRLELGLNPRWSFLWEEWQEGSRSGRNELDQEIFVNEWLARIRLLDELFISYGRENLQWGPSYLISSSNPFNTNNGRNNPKFQVGGLDYAKLVWIPNDTWTFSFIANLAEGRTTTLIPNLNQTAQGTSGAFEKVYAIKIDFTPTEKYFSVIPSLDENGNGEVGFFGGWTVSDAFLLYGEGRLKEGFNKTQLLAGGSYTFEAGPTLVIEYFRNENGCTRDPFALCFLPGLEDIDSKDLLFRRNYFLAQYTDTHIADVINIFFRYFGSPDDNSHRLIGSFEYEATDSTVLFLIPTVNFGGKETELRSLLEYQVMMGVELTY